jgi:hypothetical protein
MTDSNDIIKLNVGGTRMETLKSTLIQLPFFESMLSRWLSSRSDDSEELFVDYNPVLFMHLLDKLRNHQYEFPLISGIESMCEYFGYVNNDIYRIEPSKNIVKTDRSTKIRTHEFRLNTRMEKLFQISLQMSNYTCFHYFEAQQNDKTILDIGVIGLHNFFKKTNSTPNIWNLKQSHLNRLQNFDNLKIKISFNLETSGYKTSVYVKEKLEPKHFS